MNINEEINEPDEFSLARPANNTLITIIVIGLALIAAAYILTNRIREGSENSLALEIAITTEWNKRHLAIQKVIDERKEAAEERQFNRMVYGSSEPPPEVIQQRIERHLRSTPQD